MWTIPFVLEAVVIVTGNITVLVVFTRTSALRKRKHYLLVSLAVADLLVGVISVPMSVTTFFIAYPMSIEIIIIIQDILFTTASLLGLAAVAIERAYAVYFPFKHRTLWKGVYMIGIAVIWMMATFIAFSFFYFDGIFMFCALTVPIAVSLAVVIISYFLIWIKMNCLRGVQGHATHERDNRLTVTLLIVTVISLIAWIPFQALIVYSNLCPNGCHFKNIKYVEFGFKFLHYSNSLVNPIIYALRMPQFKRAVFNAVRCCKQHQLAVQVPNARPQPNRAREIPLTTNYNNKAFTIDECKGHAASDETLNNNPSTAQVSGRDEILNNNPSTAQVSGRDEILNNNPSTAQVSGRDETLNNNPSIAQVSGRDETLNNNPSTAQVSGRDGIQINENFLNHHTTDKDCYENKRKPHQKGSSLHGNNYNLHGNDGTYHTTVIHFPATFSNDVCRCSESTNEMKTLAIDNEGFIGTNQETKL